MIKDIVTRLSLNESQQHRLNYIFKLFDNALMDKKDYEWYLFCPLNDTTEEISRYRIDLMSVIRDNNLTVPMFETVASLGVEILIRDVNYSNLHSRVKQAILVE